MFALGTGTQNVLTTQSWFTALPSEVKVYFSSVAAEEKVLVGSKASSAGTSVRVVSCEMILLGLLGIVLWLWCI